MYLCVCVSLLKVYTIFSARDPPGPVSNLQVIKSTATTLNITWTATGVIDQFEVTYSYTINRCFGEGGAVTVNITDGTMMMYTLGDLNEDSNYTITVGAINIAGSNMTTISADTLTSSESDIIMNSVMTVPCSHFSSEWHSTFHKFH